MKTWLRLIFAGLLAVISACATTPTGRRQLRAFSQEQMNQLGSQSFSQIKAEKPLSSDRARTGYVECVTLALIGELPAEQRRTTWEVLLFRDPSANAFALPGGHIGVFEGLLNVAENQHQLAAVIGHEIGHVLAQHGNERVSQAVLTDAGLKAADVFVGKDTPYRSEILAALGLGAQFGILLPYSRDQESEADILGLEYMARAGFDPEQSVNLWQNMKRASGGGGPEFLSTHPAPETRIARLRRHMPKALAMLAQARNRGRNPSCLL